MPVTVFVSVSVPFRHDFVNRRQLQDALHEFDFLSDLDSRPTTLRRLLKEQNMSLDPEALENLLMQQQLTELQALQERQRQEQQRLQQFQEAQRQAILELCEKQLEEGQRDQEQPPQPALIIRPTPPTPPPPASNHQIMPSSSSRPSQSQSPTHNQFQLQPLPHPAQKTPTEPTPLSGVEQQMHRPVLTLPPVVLLGGREEDSVRSVPPSPLVEYPEDDDEYLYRGGGGGNDNQGSRLHASHSHNSSAGDRFCVEVRRFFHFLGLVSGFRFLIAISLCSLSCRVHGSALDILDPQSDCFLFSIF